MSRMCKLFFTNRAQKADAGERSSEKAGSGYRLKLDDKYKPTDLTKLTSMEMEDILARAIILDRCKSTLTAWKHL